MFVGFGVGRGGEGWSPDIPSGDTINKPDLEAILKLENGFAGVLGIGEEGMLVVEGRGGNFQVSIHGGGTL